MFRARLRKVALKRALDATLYRGVAAGAAVVAVSSVLERDDVASGRAGRPDPRARERLPRAVRRPRRRTAPRSASPRRAGRAVRREDRRRKGHRTPGGGALPELHSDRRADTGLVGPDDRHGGSSSRAERVHVPGRRTGRPSRTTGTQTCSCSRPQARASAWSRPRAAPGTPVVVTRPLRRRRILRRRRGAGRARRPAGDLAAVRSVLAEPALRARLAAGGVEAARRMSWEVVADRQEDLYRLGGRLAEAASKLSTDGP